MKLEWTRANTNHHFAGVRIGNELARTWRVTRYAGKWSVSFEWLSARVTLGGPYRTVAEAKSMAEQAAGLFGQRPYP